MTVKDLLNFIAIEVEAGRLSVDDEIRLWHTVYSEAAGIEDIDVQEGALELEFSKIF